MAAAGPTSAVPSVLPPAAAPILLGALVFFGAYMVYEVWRWASGNKALLTPGQFRRRLAAGFILELDLVMWLLADAILSHVARDRYAAVAILYMLWALLLVVIPMIMAVREAAFIVRQYARWRGEVVRGLGKEDRRGENGSTP